MYRECGGRWGKCFAPPRGRVRLSSGGGTVHEFHLAAVVAHRRAVVPRAALARDTVIAGCGIGAHVAGDGVTAASAHSGLHHRPHDLVGGRIATNTACARTARSDNPILPSRVVRSTMAGATS